MRNEIQVLSQVHGGWPNCFVPALFRSANALRLPRGSQCGFWDKADNVILFY